MGQPAKIVSMTGEPGGGRSQGVVGQVQSGFDSMHTHVGTPASDNYCIPNAGKLDHYWQMMPG